MNLGPYLVTDTALTATEIKGYLDHFPCDGQDEMSTAFDEAVAQLETSTDLREDGAPITSTIHLTSTISASVKVRLPSRTPDVWK